MKTGQPKQSKIVAPEKGRKTEKCQNNNYLELKHRNLWVDDN